MLTATSKPEPLVASQPDGVGDSEKGSGNKFPYYARRYAAIYWWGRQRPVRQVPAGYLPSIASAALPRRNDVRAHGSVPPHDCVFVSEQ